MPCNEIEIGHYGQRYFISGTGLQSQTKRVLLLQTLIKHKLSMSRTEGSLLNAKSLFCFVQTAAEKSISQFAKGLHGMGGFDFKSSALRGCNALQLYIRCYLSHTVRRIRFCSKSFAPLRSKTWLESNKFTFPFCNFCRSNQIV